MENLEKPAYKIALPNSQAILVLGIFSIVTSFCCGIVAFVGLTLGIIALAMAPKALALYQENPEAYTEASLKNVNSGKICAIIGVVVSGLLIFVGILYLVIAGAGLAAAFSTIPWEDIFH